VPGENDKAIISGSSAHVTIDSGTGMVTVGSLTVTAGAMLNSQGPGPFLSH
jgi:hypothetical protein